MLYGLVYYDREDYAKAKDYFKIAQDVGKDGQISYFLGLTAFKMGDYANARHYSAEAKELGYPLKGLDNMLARAGASR